MPHHVPVRGAGDAGPVDGSMRLNLGFGPTARLDLYENQRIRFLRHEIDLARPGFSPAGPAHGRA